MSDNSGPVEQFIDNEVKANEVVLFMKGTPQFPMCGFSGQVVQILDYLGVSYKGLNVLENDDLRGGIKSYSNWPTIPQLYVKGEFVGGCDIIREMFQAGAAVAIEGAGRCGEGKRRRVVGITSLSSVYVLTGRSGGFHVDDRCGRRNDAQARDGGHLDRRRGGGGYGRHPSRDQENQARKIGARGA